MARQDALQALGGGGARGVVGDAVLLRKEEGLRLRRDCARDPRVAVAGAGRADAAGKVEVPLAIAARDVCAVRRLGNKVLRAVVSQDNMRAPDGPTGAQGRSLACGMRRGCPQRARTEYLATGCGLLCSRASMLAGVGANAILAPGGFLASLCAAPTSTSMLRDCGAQCSLDATLGAGADEARIAAPSHGGWHSCSMLALLAQDSAGSDNWTLCNEASGSFDVAAATHWPECGRPRCAQWSRARADSANRAALGTRAHRACVAYRNAGCSIAYGCRREHALRRGSSLRLESSQLQLCLRTGLFGRSTATSRRRAPEKDAATLQALPQRGASAQ